MWPESGRGLRGHALEWVGITWEGGGVPGGGGAKGGEGLEPRGSSMGWAWPQGVWHMGRGHDHILPLQLWEDEPTLQRVMAAMGIDR